MTSSTTTTTTDPKNENIMQEIFAMDDYWVRAHDCEDPNDTFEQYIQLNLSNPMNAVKVLDTCKCCERHQKNRPHKLGKINEMPGSPYHFNKSCTCQCRHLSRFICRAFID